MSNVERLDDWGEFRLISDLVIPILQNKGVARSLGDDCGFLPLSVHGHLAVTTDYGPRPLVWELGHTSYWTWGWLAVVINASDLAAAGAKPIGFTSSVEAPPSMGIDEFRDFFDGMATACQEFKISSLGGNIRAAPHFECHGTAVGLVEHRQPLTRSGCRPGDIVVAIGESGLFISAYLRAQENGLESLEEDERQRLLMPRPRLLEMATLHQADIVTASSDNSDGVLGALWNIAERSLCGMELDLNEDIIAPIVRKVAGENRMNPWNLTFCWGDWQVIVAIAKDSLQLFQKIAADNKIEYTLLGKAVEGPPQLYGNVNGRRISLKILRNENFANTSYNKNVREHLSHMLRDSIFSGGARA
jgi:thiamine-monophosphate kinase